MEDCKYTATYLCVRGRGLKENSKYLLCKKEQDKDKALSTLVY